MAINHFERAYRAWPILTQIAKEQKLISYGLLGKEIGIHHRAVRHLLGAIQDYCIEEKLPPLTILVINSGGKPGSGFIAHDLNNFQEGLELVRKFNWNEIENPFEFSSSGESYKTLVQKLIDSPDESEEVYTIVKSRGIKQILFREALLKAYSQKCAFTDISFTSSLEACHIVPWAQANPSERMDVRNGILLNRFHHNLFDQDYITVTTELSIVYYDPEEEDGEYSEIERTLTSSLHGKLMRIPRLVKQRPLEKYIVRHNEISEWEL